MACRFYQHGKHDPCGVCPQRESIDAKIRELEAQLVQAKIERTKINAAMNEKHDPFYRLPHEIVSRIFESGYALDTFPDEDEIPFVLGAVCRLWRGIAWSTPGIWTSISFCINPPDFTEDLPSRLVLLHEYIERSCTLPLSIRVYADEEYVFDEEDEDIETLVSILHYCMGRWRALDLQLPPKFLLPLDKGRPPRGGSILKWLSLSTTGGDDGPPSIDFTHMTGKLECLNLMNTVFHLDLLKVGYSHLKQVFATGTADAWVTLISSAPQLEEVILSEQRGDEEWSPTPGHITHGLLRSLKVMLVSFSPMLDIMLHHLTCPNLQSLTIDHSFRNSYRLEELFNLLGYYSCSLRSLELWRLAVDDSELKAFLGALPHLENLTIQKPENISATLLFNIVFHEFHSSSDPEAQPQSILPNLVAFSYNGFWHHNDYWSFLCHPPNQPVADPSSLPLVVNKQPKLRKIEAYVEQHWGMHSAKTDTYLDEELLIVVRALQDAGVVVALSVSSLDYIIEDLVEESTQELKRIRTNVAWANIFKKRPSPNRF